MAMTPEAELSLEDRLMWLEYSTRGIFSDLELTDFADAYSRNANRISQVPV